MDEQKAKILFKNIKEQIAKNKTYIITFSVLLLCAVYFAFGYVQYESKSKELSQQIDVLAEQYEELSSDYENLEKSNKTLKADIKKYTDQQSKVDELTDKVSELESQVNTLTEENTKLKSDNETLKSENESLKQQESTDTASSSGGGGGSIGSFGGQPADTSSGGVMVWISETGSKYHNKNNCGRMNPNKAYQMSRESAEASGYDPCSKCF